MILCISHLSAGNIANYKDACRNGEVQGCYYLGLSYAKGEGIRKDIENARMFLSLACDEGYHQA